MALGFLIQFFELNFQPLKIDVLPHAKHVIPWETEGKTSGVLFFHTKKGTI